MSFTVVELSGTPYEQGLRHGAALADAIVHNCEVYYDRLRREARLSRDEVGERCRDYLPSLRAQSEDYMQGMRGIADGAGLSFDDIVMLNLRYELLYFQYGLKQAGELGEMPAGGDPPGGGCTAYALLPPATTNGHLLMGQNWDWIPETRGALLRGEEPDGLRWLGFTEAGMLGAKIGLNSEGIGLAINGMLSTKDDWARHTRPFHLRCYEILRRRDFAAAVAVVEDEPRACTTNFLIAQAPEEVLDLEAAPDVVGRITCEGGCLAHANHFEDPAALGVEEPPNDRRHNSEHRAARLRRLLSEGQPFDLPSLQGVLRDHDNHPNSVCRHEDGTLPPEEFIHTVTSIIMDLRELRLWASDGPPCASDYQTLAL
jgi:isopenicillin-N N-acyltransferase-like protein